MTTTPPPDRLDRIEALVLANSEAISRIGLETAANTQAIANLTERVGIMADRVDTLSDLFRELVPIIQAIRTDMQAMQSDIRGLQTENRRILERLERGQGEQP